MKSKFLKIQPKGIVLLVLLGAIFVGAGIFLEILEESHPPLIFPFNDSFATYTIIKDPTSNLYHIVYDTTKDKEKLGTCDEPIDGLARCWVEGDFHNEVVIGSSPVDLSSFIDKRVEVIGEFVYTTRQCIVDMCRSVGSEKVGLKIDSVQHENNETK